MNFISLQMGEPLQELAAFSNSIADHSSFMSDMADTAALIETLDLVISVDTSVAHLAAALGKETWVLLPYSADWRWGDTASNTPWYPSMRLFRQETPGEWRNVVKELVRSAACLLRPIQGHSGLEWC